MPFLIFSVSSFLAIEEPEVVRSCLVNWMAVGPHCAVLQVKFPAGLWIQKATAEAESGIYFCIFAREKNSKRIWYSCCGIADCLDFAVNKRITCSLQLSVFVALCPISGYSSEAAVSVVAGTCGPNGPVACSFLS